MTNARFYPRVRLPVAAPAHRQLQGTHGYRGFLPSWGCQCKECTRLASRGGGQHRRDGCWWRHEWNLHQHPTSQAGHPLHCAWLPGGFAVAGTLPFSLHVLACCGGRQVAERSPKPGGTWFENRYPNCACDIPFLQYTFSFEPHVVSELYAPSATIEVRCGRFSATHSRVGVQRWFAPGVHASLCRQVQRETVLPLQHNRHERDVR